MKGRSVLLLVIILFLTNNMNAQEIVKLWESSPPTNSKLRGEERLEDDGTLISNVVTPKLHIYKASDPNGKAVMICPGGSYARLAVDREGKQFALWLNSKGITAVVLHYRVPNKNKEIPLEDARQAIRYVKTNAQELGIHPEKVGISGFSVGGHLASTASTHFDIEEVDTRPDFCIIFYPVISMVEDVTHRESRNNLLGNAPSFTDIDMFSNEERVTIHTPPTIILLCDY